MQEKIINKRLNALIDLHIEETAKRKKDSNFIELIEIRIKQEKNKLKLLNL